MLDLVVVAGDLLADARVVLVVVCACVVELVAVVVVSHVRGHICLIVIDVHGLGVLVACGVVSPVPGRAPGPVGRLDEICEHHRSCDEYGLDDVVGSVDIA